MVFGGNVRKMATVMTAKDRATPTMKRVQAQGDRTKQSMSDTSASVGRLAMAFKGAAVATGVLGAALGALVATQGKTEQTFARLAEVSGATNAEMERIRDTAIDIGKNLPISINQAASAMEQLAFAGFEAEEAMSAANGVADLAVASQLNMQESARTTASALRMFNLEADETVQVTSALAATFSTSAANISEISGAIERVGATATTVGVSLQEVTAAIGVMADAGMRGRRAGTALNRTLLELGRGSDKATQALQQMNLSLEDIQNAEGGLENLSVVLGELQGGMQNLESDAERLQVATELAGARGARALIPLIENQEALNEKMGAIFRSEMKESMATLGTMTDEELERINELEAVDLQLSRDMTGEELAAQLEEINESGASTAEMANQLQVAFGMSQQASRALAEDVADASVSTEQIAEAMGGATTAGDIAASQMDTVSGSVKFLKSSLDTMAFAIFSGAGPAIQWFNEQLAAGINVLNNNEAVMKAVGATLVALTGILATITVALGVQFVGAAISASLAGGALSGTFIATAVSAGTLSGALYAVAAGVWAVLSPLLPVIAAIGVLVAAFFVLKEAIEKNFLGVGEDFAVLMERIGAVFNFVMPILKQTGRLLWELGKVLLVIAAAPIVAQIFLLIKGLKILTDVIIWTFEAFMDIINGTRTFGQVMSEAGDLIYDFFAGIGQFILDAITGIDWAGLGIMIIKGIALGFVYAVGGLPALLLTLFWDEIVGFLLGLDWANIGISLIQMLITGMVVAIFGIPGLIGMLFHDQIMNALDWVIGKLQSVGANIVNAIVSSLIPDPVIDAMMGVANAIASFLPFSNADRGPLSSIMSVGGNIVSAIVGGILAYIGFVRDAMMMVGEAIWSAIQMYIEFVTGVGEMLIGLIVDGVMAYIGFVRQAFMLIHDAISWAIDAYVSLVTGVGEMLVSLIVQGITGYISLVEDALMFIWDAISWAVNSYIDLVTGVGGAIVDAIASGLLGGVSIVTDAIDSVVGAIADFLPFSNANRGPLSTIMSVGGNIVGAIAGGLRGAVGMVTGAAKAVAGAISDVLGGVADAAMGIGSKIAGGIADGIKGGVDMVKGAAGAVAGAAGDAVSGATDMAMGAGSALVGGVADGVSGAASMAGDAGAAVADTVGDGVSGAADAAGDAASDVAGAIGGALPGSDAEFGPLSNLTQVGPDLVKTLASGIQGEQGMLQSQTASAMQNVVGAVQQTPLGQAASGLMGEAAGAIEGTPLGDAVGGAAGALGIDIGGGDGGDSGSDGRPPTASDKSPGGSGPLVEVNQTINMGESSSTAAEVRQAAEEGSTDAIEAAIAELERLLKQDMNA